MKVHINTLHILAVIVPIAAWAYGWPWFICLPAMVALLAAAARFTIFTDSLETDHDHQPND